MQLHLNRTFIDICTFLIIFGMSPRWMPFCIFQLYKFGICSVPLCISGMIMWRGEHFMMKHYVFHRPQYVLDLCRELLQAEGITLGGYDGEGKEDMRESFSRQQYNNMVNVFCTQGLLQVLLGLIKIKFN